MNEGTLHSIETDQIEFANDLFLRDQPDLIGKIKRKETKRQIQPTPKVSFIICLRRFNCVLLGGNYYSPDSRNAYVSETLIKTHKILYVIS